MDFARDSIDGVKSLIILSLVIIVASVIGVPLVSFGILLFGVSIASIIGIAGYILYVINKADDSL